MRRFAVLGLVVLAGCGGAAAARPQPEPASQLRKVDDFPLYELTDSLPTPALYARTDTTGFACTVFMAAGGSPVLGRNFDFHDEPALVLHHRPPGAYRSVSLVDISYLGFDRRHLSRLSQPGAERALARASRLPFDGMNEKGLAVAMAAVPAARTQPLPDRTTGSLGVMRLVLDRAATVAQAVRIFKSTAIDFSGGPPLHYLVADAGGGGAVIEYVDGRVHVFERGTKPYIAMTNFTLASKAKPDARYRTATATLAKARGTMTTGSTIDLLQATKQSNTRWSAAYDLRARKVTIAMGQDYGGHLLTFGV
jgi:choloylglycine hydrolase